MSRSLLVSGATGFIGRAVVSAALRRGWRVTGLARHQSAECQGLASVDHVQADLLDRTSLRNSLGDRRFDYVINLGGEINHGGFFDGGRAMINTHFDGTMNLIETTSHPELKGFVQVGSSDEYGDNPAPQREAMREHAISPYSMAKVAATQFVQMLHRSEQFPGKVARLFLVYGPGQDQNRFVPQLVRGCLQDTEFDVSEGEQLRDFCFVDDIATGLLNLATSDDANGKCINLGSGEPTTIRSIIDMVTHLLQRGHPQFGRIAYRQGENMALYPDISVARSLIDWQPSISLEQGLRRTINHYRDA